jgi:hypothetical protein
MKHLFLQEATLAAHLEAQTNEGARYVATLLLLLQTGVELSPGARGRTLAAAWARRDHALADHLLAQKGWGLPDVVKALQLLDTGRAVRALSRRIARLQEQGRVSKRRLGQLRSALNDLQREACKLPASLTGALARRVRRWVRSFSAEKLEFYAMTFPLAPWRELADLVHLAPSDFQLPWFLGVAFGAAPPEGSMMAACQGVAPADLPALLARLPVPYSYLRLRHQPLSEEARDAVAAYEPLGTLLWYYEELRGPAADRRIAERLAAGEDPDIGYGKLMERLLTLQDLKVGFLQRLLPVAERRLRALRPALEPPVVVLGDASSSMTVSIRVATIIGSLLAALSQAELRFFNQGLLRPKVQPRCIADVLAVTKETVASGSTSPAAALWPSLSERALVRSFLVVTDEQENTAHKGQMFDAMFEAYRRDCFPAQVTFVSFTAPTSQGAMTQALSRRQIPFKIFRFDPRRPDLTKLDALLGVLAAEAASFDELAEQVAAVLREGKALAEVAAALPGIVAPEDAPAAAPAQEKAQGWLGRLLGALRPRS